jgi:hypothetical protein
MTRRATIDRLPKELAYRSNDGIEVWLLWTKADNRLFVLLVDSRTGDTFEIDVESHDALDAFHHPYGYAAWRGIEYTAPRRQVEPAAA